MSVRLEAVRASAGSGKTYRITTCYLEALQAGAAPESILATTFTRKAAGEILGRVLQRLAEEARDDPARRSDLACLCHSLHRVAVGTIDSFFHRLARGFRYELDLPADFRLLDDRAPEAVQIRLEAIQAALEEAHGDGGAGPLLELLERLQPGAAQRQVVEGLDALMRDLYDLYRQAPEEAWSALHVPEQVAEGALGAAVHQLLELAAAETNTHWRNALDANATAAAAGDWEQFCSAGLAKAILAGNETFQRRPVTVELAAVYAPLIQQARATLLGELARLAAAARSLLQRFDHHYTRLRRRRQALLFADLPHALRSLARTLPDSTLEALGYRLDATVRHLLLDEFQDTSADQWETLRPLAERIAGGDSGSLFCVGDVKQAIFGWRGGSAEIFDRLDDCIAGLKWEHTELSYRSSQIVLDAVNDVFSALASSGALTRYPGEAGRWEASFVPHEAKRGDLPGYVELATSPRPPDPEEDCEDAEEDAHFSFTADRIAALAQQLPDRTIGVLMRTNEGVRQLLYLLHQRGRGVHASGEGGSSLDDDPAVETILAALTLADHPGHTAAAFQVAHSPLGPTLGLRPGAEAGGPAAVASELRRRLLTEGYAGVITCWARELAPSCDPRGARRLAQLAALADAYEPQATLRPADFVRHVRGTRVQEPSPARVRVMTIHAAKGLEFDVVVLPELARNVDPVSARPLPAVIVDRDAAAGPIRAVYRYPTQSLRRISPQLQSAYERHCDRELRESLCLLYVAMTRAKHAVHMFIPPLPAKGGGISHASILRAALRSKDLEESMEGNQTLYRHGDSGWARASAPAGAPPRAAETRGLTPIVLAPSSGAGRRTWRQVRPSDLARSGARRAADLLALQESPGQRFGNFIHALISELTWLDEARPPDAALIEAGRKAVPGQAEAWYEDALVHFRSMLAQPAVRAVFTRPALADGSEPELWRERRFAVRIGDALVNGAFDRVSITRENGRVAAAHLIDFKIDPADEGSLPALVEVYRPQVQSYRSALAAMLGLPLPAIRAQLLFVSQGIVVEVGQPVSRSPIQ
jgi:ATP-dependent helicase/nuclease subunit A